MKNRNFVNLSVNPCKMCMPMGAALAFKGIENSMMLLHGSQGCSTYIRRHMATHFNEPVDIGSSSLTEQGTVYGGAENLKKAIKNVIKLYNPEVIGVATTCLAETIGEDIAHITDEFKAQEDLRHLPIIPVPTPGYGGTQFEGYYAVLRKAVQVLARDRAKHRKINVIASHLNPGDIRHIKGILDLFKIEYILLPDISRTLDGPYAEKYRRISPGGTTIKDIRCMPGAAATVEMGLTVDQKYSPGRYLEERFGVPLHQCAVPIGLANTDAFVNLISRVTGKPVPTQLKERRGRYMDAMIDSHKHNGQGRAVIFGEPELVYGITDLCLENGVKPVVIATGAKNNRLKELLKAGLDNMEEKCVLLDDTDFETIQKYAKDLRANLLIGNSDGKWIEEKEGIPLVRIGFPVHDRIGAQRKVSTGYEGSMGFMDAITNAILENKEKAYRKTMYRKYYKGDKKAEKMTVKTTLKALNTVAGRKSHEEKTAEHPCYHPGAGDCARMHLPVAPKCNISCNYCSRKYDCPNESRPGVTSEVLTPGQALEKYIEVKSKVEHLTVVGIAGPGDALADFENTRKTLALIRGEDPEVTFCLSTNGLMLPFYANDLIRAGVSHVTVTVNAIDTAIGAKIYKNVRYLGNRLEGEAAAKALRDNQLAGLRYLSSAGVVCKVNIVMIQGVNDSHVPEVVRTVKKCGAFMTNIMGMIPAPGSVFEELPAISEKALYEMRKQCEKDIKQMYHCRQCRADAIGTLDNDRSGDFRNTGCHTAERVNDRQKPTKLSEREKACKGCAVNR